MANETDIQIVRAPQVAGYFYPDDTKRCATMVEADLAAAADIGISHPKIIVAPHAGYIYSGPIAGTAYRTLEDSADTISRVVLVGPAHHVPFEGLATSSADAWETPLGTVPIDRQSIRKLQAVECFHVCDKGYANEHSLEVHIPFLQTVLKSFSLVPILVGNATADAISQALDIIWGGPETLIVISSDLSHFHEVNTARAHDTKTRHEIEMLKGESLTGRDACGYRGIAAALKQARKRDLRVTALDVRNSADTAGTPDRVVGYGAFAMEYAADAHLCAADRTTLANAAYRALEEAIATGKPPALPAETPSSPALAAIRATFVTLTIGGHLRGCIGSVAPHRPLLDDVIANAYRAGFADRRFSPLTMDELSRLDIDISILSHLRPITFESDRDLIAQLRPDIDGLVIEDGDRKALFLPSVWKSLPEADSFLARLKAKAGLPPSHWSDSLRAYRFTAEYFEAARPAPTTATPQIAAGDPAETAHSL